MLVQLHDQPATHSNTGSKSRQPKSSLTEQEVKNLLAWLAKLKSEGKLPTDLEPAYKHLETLKEKSNGNFRALWRAIETLLERIPELKKLADKQREASISLEVTREECLTPPLPESLVFSPETSIDACQWLNTYTEFSRRWSPRGYEHFHTAVGVSILSAVAARRIWLPFGPSGEYTPLFIALVAATTQHAKSTTAGIGKNVLRKAGLSWLLCPDTITPQKLLSNMSGHLPKNFAALSEPEREIALKRYAMSGQVFWFYDEFGQHLDAMTAKNGIMADFKGILRRFDDCEEETSNDTLTRDLERIERPYMALLASMTPADARPYAGKDAKFWKDGFFARFAFITPPPDDRKRDRFPEGEMHLPPDLITPLTSWHQRLGEPTIELIEETNKKGEVTGYQAIRGPLPLHTCTLEPGVVDALYAYSDALEDIVHDHHLEQLAGNYGRLPKKALRLAMLFASLENNGHIELRHWARGQEIAETWRGSLHELYAQVTVSENSENETLENDILTSLKRKNKPMSARDIRLSSRKFRAVESKAFRQILDNLAIDGYLKRTGGDTVMYQALAENEHSEK